MERAGAPAPGPWAYVVFFSGNRVEERKICDLAAAGLLSGPTWKRKWH
jgi:hypothetical protein